MKKVIKHLLCFLIDKVRHYLCYVKYKKQFKAYLLMAGYENVKAPGEDAYVKKWSKLTSRIEPYSYRFFSHFCGYSPNIVPEDVGRSYIEEILNPIGYQKAYQDKNLFPRIVGTENVPRTIVCRINGSCLLDSNYSKIDGLHLLSNVEGNFIILKPTVESGSGRGILKFSKQEDGVYTTNTGQVLTEDFLLSYGNDFCLQEAVEQHEFMNYLCSSSVNTLRLSVYKSIQNDNCHVTAAIIRIGKNGEYLDNAHAGGRFVGIDIKTGLLGKYVYDQFGNKSTRWNSVDFSTEHLIIPNWEKIIKFAEYVGGRIIHCRQIALDIALTNEGNPILIEYNVGQGFSYWLFQYTGQEVWGVYTDEIIDYCQHRLNSNK